MQWRKTAALLVVVCASVALGYVFGHRGTDAAPRTRPRITQDTRVSEGSAPLPARGLRTEIRAAVEQASMRGEDELDEYLTSLENQARRRGTVTALDVEPGLAMIQRVSGDPAKMLDFSERMRRLQDELTGRHDSPVRGIDHVVQRLTELSREIPELAGDEKQTKIREYENLALRAAVDGHPEFVAELNRIAATAAAPSPADPRVVDALGTRIRGESDAEKKQEMIRQYFALAGQLDEGARLQRLAGANELFGSSDQSTGVMQ